MMKKWFFTVLGALLLAIGAIGVFLPIWPTTPFVLLAAGCFGAGNPEIYKKLAESPIFGEYIRNYKEKTGVSVKTKVQSLIFLWGMLALSVWLSGKMWMIYILSAVGIGVTIHILSLKTKVK